MNEDNDEFDIEAELEMFDKDMDIYFDTQKKINTEIPTPSEFVISTISITGKIGDFDEGTLDLPKLCESFEENKDEKIIKIKHQKNITRKNKKNNSKERIFYNQVSFLINPYYNSNNNVNIYKKISIKIFLNGNIQISGLKQLDLQDAYDVLKILIENIKKLHYTIPLEIKNCKIILINGNYELGYKVNRTNLLNILKNKYNLFATLEPCVYQGINIRYFRNKQNPKNDGICHCNQVCLGKGSGDGDGNCSKLTIAVFQSGAVIIVGKATYEDIIDTYNIMNNIFSTHYIEIVQLSNSRKINNKGSKIKVEVNTDYLHKVLLPFSKLA